MDIKKINLSDLKKGDMLFRGSLCEVLEISAPFMRGYGYDNHYFKAETVAIKCQAVYDYDVHYSKESGKPLMPREYTFDYTTESQVMIVTSGETVTVTSFTGAFDEVTGNYLLPGQTIKIHE
ncbi:hypothetical protein GECvBMG_gp207c [Salmonella phage GEC_vB_MG]|nr:hypothetical protein GECvBMG_gp207c [Salmonella phage GEC_vB_MG]